jgi:hypothetical protein
VRSAVYCTALCLWADVSVCVYWQTLRLDEMQTPLQFVLHSHSLQQQRNYKAMKQAAAARTGGTGSFLAWHGSGLKNWHAILREGLRNLSASRGQVAVAVVLTVQHQAVRLCRALAQDTDPGCISARTRAPRRATRQRPLWRGPRRPWCRPAQASRCWRCVKVRALAP